jgi:hypothetical protein
MANAMSTSKPTAAQTQAPTPRLLSGASGGGRGDDRTARPATAAETFTATEPFDRAQLAPAPTRAGQPPPAADSLPRWAKGVVIGGVLLAVAMPASVLLSRSMMVQDAMAAQSGSQAAMVCTSGEGRAVDGSNLLGWLFGGSYFHCGDWETRDARQQREREQYESNYLARERAKQGLR